MKQIIIGRNNFDRTAYITDLIKKDLSSGCDNIIVIVPDQFTFEMERELMEKTGAGLFEIQVLSFRRLISKLRDELGTKGCTTLDEVNKAMFVTRLLHDKNDDLRVYGGAYTSPGFGFNMAKTITECKQFGVEPEVLDEVGKSLSGKTKDKLLDIMTVYREYENSAYGFKDNEEIINIITGYIRDSLLLRDARVYIDHFDVFTEQGYRLIEETAKVCSSLCVCVCSDSSSKNLFYLTSKTVAKLRDIVPDFETVRLCEIDGGRYIRKLPEDVAHLERNLFDGDGSIAEMSDGSVELFSFSTAIDEIDHAVAKIIELKNEKGYDYKDICLMVGDVEEYGRALEQCMLDCGVPCFLDRKTPLMSYRLARFVIYSLKTCVNDTDASAYTGMIKQGLMLSDKADIQSYENLILKKGLKNAVIQKERDMEEQQRLLEALTAKNNPDDAEKINLLKEQTERQQREAYLLKMPDKLKKALKKAETAEEMAQAVIDYLEPFAETVSKRADDLRRRDEQAIDEKGIMNKVVDTLRRMQLIFKDTVMETDRFISVLETGLCSVNMGTVPERLDSVLVGEISRTKIQRVKCLLVLGISDGVIPKITKKTGLLSDYDLSLMGENKIGRDSADLNNLEQLLTYKMFSTPTDYLYLSHSDRGLYGNERTNKMLMPKVRKLLGGIEIHCDVPFNEPMQERMLRSKVLAQKSLMANLRSGCGESLVRGAYAHYEAWAEEKMKPDLYEIPKNRIEPVQAQRLYKDTVMSASRIESYFKCAFMQFVKYGLQPKPKELYRINKLDTGMLLHEIIEDFSRDILKETESCGDVSELPKAYENLRATIETGGRIEEIVEKRLRDDEVTGESVYSKDRIGIFMKHRLTAISKAALIGVLDDLRDNGFVMTHSEQVLSRLRGYELEEMKLGDKRLEGKIDRIDLSGDDIRIVDYKQGGSVIDYTSVYAGVKLQLLLYMKAAVEHFKKEQGRDFVPAELQYYKMNSEYRKADSYDKFENESDPEDKRTSSIRLIKDGETDSKRMERLVDFGMQKAKEAADKIYSGDIGIRPYVRAGRQDDCACTYCEYKDICKIADMKHANELTTKKLEDIIGGKETGGSETD